MKFFEGLLRLALNAVAGMVVPSVELMPAESRCRGQGETAFSHSLSLNPGKILVIGIRICETRSAGQPRFFKRLVDRFYESGRRTS